MDILIFLSISVLLILIIYLLMMNSHESDEITDETNVIDENHNEEEYKNIENLPSKITQTIFSNDEDDKYNHKYCNDGIPKQYYPRYYSNERELADEDFKKIYQIYASEYDDSDYNDYEKEESNVDALSMKYIAVYDKYSLYDYDDLKEYNIKNKNVSPLQKNNKEELNSQSKENIDEYLISLFGKEIIEKRAIKENVKENELENADKYLKMFFGDNCDLDKLKNNPDKKDIQ